MTESKTSDFQVYSEFGYELKRATPGSAGCDISSAEERKLAKGERHAFSTGLYISLPEGTYGRIAPRSGLAYKNGIDVLAGVVDQDYVNEVKVILINLGDKDFQVNKGDKIAQLVLERIVAPNVAKLTKEQFAKLAKEKKEIGEHAGFGSTGV
jgi:dUTP pyrophosphatase